MGQWVQLRMRKIDFLLVPLRDPRVRCVVPRNTRRSGKFQDFPAILLGAPFLQSPLDEQHPNGLIIEFHYKKVQ